MAYISIPLPLVMEERRATLLKGQLVHAVLVSEEGTVMTVGLNICCV